MIIIIKEEKMDKINIGDKSTFENKNHFRTKWITTTFV